VVFKFSIGLDNHSILGYIVAQSGGATVVENSVVRARIDARIKAEAATVLAAMGLTVSDAFRLMMVRIAMEKALPFEPLIPNAQTIAAIKQARIGNLPRARNIKELMTALHEDD
jgi:DNA-damage-inducible protein J